MHIIIYNNIISYTYISWGLSGEHEDIMRMCVIGIEWRPDGENPKFDGKSIIVTKFQSQIA